LPPEDSEPPSFELPAPEPTKTPTLTESTPAKLKERKKALIATIEKWSNDHDLPVNDGQILELVEILVTVETPF